ncbi:MAG: threonine ammonia-lyase [Campylobacterales bacterium]|nr:threonine ammonia-lyase [Campylobacterales bacterium]
MINLEDIKKAKENIGGVVKRTPFSLAPNLTKLLDGNIYLKKENLQYTGAYKLRGAYNRISNLSEADRKKGVIAASAGNHAQGVAHSAFVFGIKSIIVMPETTPLLKVNGTKDLGAEVILSGGNYDEAFAFAQKYATENDLTLIHPFEDDDVIAGQGTVALEILEDLENVDKIVVPVGGGGLISGVATAIKEINPNIKIIGVSASGAPAMKKSFDAKQPIDTTEVKTIADGIAVRDTSTKTLEYILKGVDELITVDDNEIANAILFLMEKQKLIVEGAGAVGVAALLHHHIETKENENIAVILSGGNIDVTMLSLIIEKGLLKSQRKMKIKLKLIDKPGSLQHFTEMLTQMSANIVEIGYDRTDKNLEIGDAWVYVALETKGSEHQEEIRTKLKEEKFQFYEE